MTSRSARQSTTQGTSQVTVNESRWKSAGQMPLTQSSSQSTGESQVNQPVKQTSQSACQILVVQSITQSSDSQSLVVYE